MLLISKLTSHTTRKTIRFRASDCVVHKYQSWLYEERDATVTVISDHYTHILENIQRPYPEHLKSEERNVWFHQDGITAHTARRSLIGLNEMFEDRLISSHDLPNPLTSPIGICNVGLLNHECILIDLNLLTTLRLLFSKEIATAPHNITLLDMATFIIYSKECINNESQKIWKMLSIKHGELK